MGSGVRATCEGTKVVTGSSRETSALTFIENSLGFNISAENRWESVKARLHERFPLEDVRKLTKGALHRFKY